MIKTFVIFFLLSSVIILFSIMKIILMKKSIFYKHVDKKKRIINYDYLMDYDGNWLFKKINYDELYTETKDESIVDLKKKIRIYQIIYVSLFVTLMLLGVILKILAKL
jgi:hypothetical protein